MTEILPGKTISFNGVDFTVLSEPKDGQFKALQDLPNGRSRIIKVDLPTDRVRANCSG